MRITLAVAAFTIAAFQPITGHAAVGDAGDAGATAGAEAGAPSVATGGSAGATGGSAGATGGSAGATGGVAGAAPNKPGISLPDPGTDDSNSCAIAGPRGQLGAFGTTLLLGAALLTFRRRRAR